MGGHDEQVRLPIRVVELSKVTDEEVERVLNQMLDQGYELDNVHFAMREASRRPSMAFLVFYESFDPDEIDEEALHLVDGGLDDDEPED
ncbi:MAG: hypothetical protein P9M14_02480 [Candidatus Alcyoniella australis]|nr:hypothetical protein [Candidatus Alcyoniella australis]